MYVTLQIRTKIIDSGYPFKAYLVAFSVQLGIISKNTLTRPRPSFNLVFVLFWPWNFERESSYLNQAALVLRV